MLRIMIIAPIARPDYFIHRPYNITRLVPESSHSVFRNTPVENFVRNSFSTRVKCEAKSFARADAKCPAVVRIFSPGLLAFIVRALDIAVEKNRRDFSRGTVASRGIVVKNRAL